MIRALVLALLASPVWADADPGPIPDMADVATLRACLSNQPVQTASSCRLMIFNPCAERAAGDLNTLRLCHLNEADAWDFIRIQDSWPRAVAAAHRRDAAQGQDVNGFTGLEAALRSTRPAWLAYRDTQCALAHAGSESFDLGGVAGAACWSRLSAERVIDLNTQIQRWQEDAL